MNHASKLLKLADYLEDEVPEHRFDISTFGVDRSCGSTHCSLGWYASLFPEEKLKLVPAYVGRYDIVIWDRVSYRPAEVEDIAQYFDLPRTTILDLFYDLGIETPEEAARIIRKAVNENSS